jgi:hypothetical protein
VIRTVIIQLYLHIGLFEDSRAGELPLHVLDVEASGYPHRFVVGLDREEFRV